MKWISIRVSTVTTGPLSIVRTQHLALAVVCLLTIGPCGETVSAQAPSARDLYQAAQAGDREARAALAQSFDRPDAPLSLMRAAMLAYKTVVLRHPTSGYCDDALWYGAQMGGDTFARFGQARDRQAAIAMLKLLQSEYPASPFVARITPTLDHLATAEPGTVAAAMAAARSPAASGKPPATSPSPSPAASGKPPAQSSPAPVMAAGTRPATSPSPSPAASGKPPTPSPAPAMAAAATAKSGTPTPPATSAGSTTAAASAAPAANSRGGYSIARQLGMRVGRVVLDPGHGGSDPGALGVDISESAITLDIALKLEALLAEAAGVDVVLTRRSDVYVGLQERTAIANRDGADLFVSIHVNANRDKSIQGIETFLLNFASTPGAAAVAARENAGSTTTMSHLDTLVKQIALNNKRDESRELAAQLQTAMVKRLRSTDRELRDLGVKQAPFVVLIGASMPSVLVEVAFLTNRRESQLLATDTYRQRVAESLSDGVTRYLRSLKRSDGVAGLPAEKPVAKLPR